MKVFIVLFALLAVASAGYIRSSGWGGNTGWNSGWNSGWNGGHSNYVSSPRVVKVISLGHGGGGWNNGGWNNGGWNNGGWSSSGRGSYGGYGSNYNSGWW